MADPSGPVVRYDVHAHVATITLNRPEAYNSLDYEAYELLSARFREAGEDTDVRAVVFTGTGRGFCTGDDVRKLLGAGAAELARRLGSGELELPGSAMRRCDKPIIGAVNGAAVGYGMELSLLCDIRYAAPDARFSEMFVRRAIVAGADSFELLPQIVGASAAAELLMSGDLISADRALELGLVSKVVPQDQLLAEATALAAHLAANPPLAVQAAKHALRLARAGRPDELRAFIGGRGRELLATADHQESVAAFLERREPRFIGR
ncbi:MAG: enoyl-CoA hydratase/isomerase family protein [Acidimicrobiia bacterium]